MFSQSLASSKRSISITLLIIIAVIISSTLNFREVDRLARGHSVRATAGSCLEIFLFLFRFEEEVERSSVTLGFSPGVLGGSQYPQQEG